MIAELLLAAVCTCGVNPERDERVRAYDVRAVNRRITEQFLSSDPLAYKPAGTDIAKHFREGYGWGRQVFYATVSLWVNALDNARQFVCNDRYVISTANNADGHMELYVTPVEQLRDRTSISDNKRTTTRRNEK